MEADIYPVTETPVVWEVGSAVEDGDNFFDAVAQGLRRIKPNIDFTVKSLRRACKDLLQNGCTKIVGKDRQMRDKVRSQIILTARNPLDESVILPAFEISDSKLLDGYLERIVYASEEAEKISTENIEFYKSLNDIKFGSTLQIPVPGRQNIDDLLISRSYNIMIHYLIEGCHMSHIVDQFGNKIFLNKDNYVFDEENTIHLKDLNNGLFMPVFKVAESQQSKAPKQQISGKLLNPRQKLSFEEQPESIRHKSKVKKTELEYFFSLRGNKPKLEKELKNVFGKEVKKNQEELKKLYHQALEIPKNGYEVIVESIESLVQEGSNKKLKHYIKSEKLCRKCAQVVAIAFHERKVLENDSLNDIFKQVDSVQIVIDKYQKFKIEQSYKQYNTHDEIFYDENPNKVYDFCDHKLEILCFQLLSETIDRLKLRLKWELLEALQFFLTHFKLFLGKTEYIFPYQSKTEMSKNFHDIDKSLVHGWIVHLQKKQLSEYLVELSDKLDIFKNKLREKVKTDGNVTIESEQLRKIIGVKNYRSKYEGFYKHYWIIRDIDSLYKIIDYIKLTQSVNLENENETGKLIIQRAIQVIGEFSKSSPSSPYLSAKTKDYLRDIGVPIEALIGLRDTISHSFTLYKRINIERDGDNSFTDLKSELAEFKKIAVRMLKIVEAKQIQWQLGQVIGFLSHDDSHAQLLQKGIAELEVFKENKEKAFLTQSSSNRFKAIENFSNNLNSKDDKSQISWAFNNRLTTLITIFDRQLLKKNNLKPCDNQMDTLIQEFKSDKKLKAVVDILLLDLMSVFSDRSLNLKGLVTRDLPFVIGFWSNASLRNFLGHGSSYVHRSPEDLNLRNFLSNALNFITDKEEVTALVKLYEDDEVKKILYDLIKDKNDISLINLRKEWLSMTHEIRIQTKLNKHSDSIAIILNSIDHTTNLIDMLFSRNNLTVLIKLKSYKEVIKILNEDQDICEHVNDRDENFETLLHHVIRNERLEDEKNEGNLKKIKEMVGTMIEKGYMIKDDDIELLQEGEPLYNTILHAIIQKDSIENFKKMKGDIIAEAGKNDLCTAAKAGSQNIVFYLLKEGVNPNEEVGGYSAIHYAAQGGHLDVVLELRDNKARYMIGKPGKYSLLQLISNTLNKLKERNKAEETNSKKKELDRKIENYEKIHSLIIQLLIEALFENLKEGNKEVIREVERLESNEREEVTTARNEEGCTLFVTAIFCWKDDKSSTREEIMLELKEILKNK